MLYILCKFLDYNYCLHLKYKVPKVMAYSRFFYASCMMDSESLMTFSFGLFVDVIFWFKLLKAFANVFSPLTFVDCMLIYFQLCLKTGPELFFFISV